MAYLLKNHVMGEIKEDRELSLTCYKDKQLKDVVRFCYDSAERAINKLPQYYPGNVIEEEWVPVKERMPEEKDSMFAKFKGTEKWKRGMFEKRSANVIVTVESGEGTRFCMEARTIDGRWSAEDPLLREWKIIAWRKFPEPYKEKRQ